MGRFNNINWTKSMLKEGKSEEEILAILKKSYLDKGRDEKFADKRSKLYLKLAKEQKELTLENKGLEGE